MIHVKTKIDRADKDLIAELGTFSAATIHEAQGRKGSLHPAIKPIDRDMKFCGSAFTVKCHPRDNLMLQVAISYAQPGDVLIVSSGDQAAGQFGDVLANACVARGITALVTDGGVRDTREIRELGIPRLLQARVHRGNRQGISRPDQPSPGLRRTGHLSR
ncbi:hypothetical protein ACQGAO_28835 [Rhodococcus sp. 1.20]